MELNHKERKRSVSSLVAPFTRQGRPGPRSRRESPEQHTLVWDVPLGRLDSPELLEVYGNSAGSRPVLTGAQRRPRRRRGGA